jgi:hypothetical protein
MGEVEKKDSSVLGRAVGVPITKPKEQDYTPIIQFVTRSGVKLRGVSNKFATDDGEVELKGKLWTEYQQVRGQNLRKELFMAEEELRSAENQSEMQSIIDMISDAATVDAQEYMLETYPNEIKQQTQ